jgi:signal transduction histidine kinase
VSRRATGWGSPVLLIAFALAVCVIAGIAAWWTLIRLQDSLDHELDTRLEAVAVGASTAIEPEDLVNLLVEGKDGLAYGNMALDLELVRSSAKATDIFLVDKDGRVLLDLVREENIGKASPLFRAERVATTSALAGTPSATGLYRTGEFVVKTGFAPVFGPGHEVRAVLGVEAGADFLQILADTRRHMAVALIPGLVAVFLLSLLFLRLSLARQRWERELARAENLAAVGELGATLAHEVRNPLSVIKHSAELLRRDYQGPEPELFDYIAQECDRLAATVQRTLDFARPPRPGERFGDAEEAARATVGLLEPECRDRDVTLVFEAKGEGPWRVTLGLDQLKQALLNLIKNALDAIVESRGDLPEGSRPATGAPGREARLVVRLQRSGSRIALSVEDNGPGMDRETLRRAKDPFFTTRTRGSGLGLAIVDRLVRDAGGELRLVSQKGRGTTAILVLKPAPAVAKAGARA